MKIKIDPDIKDLVPEYLENLENTIQNMKMWAQESNFEDIVREAHKCKGHGKAYGFSFVSTIGEKIEARGKEKNLDKVMALIKELETEFKDLEIEY
jgi:HPt (histidine-containing phosphotransfer) domain-containing protein